MKVITEIRQKHSEVKIPYEFRKSWILGKGIEITREKRDILW